MQKWIGIGKIDGEPEDVEFEGSAAKLIWINCPRDWDNDSDNIPVLFLGKRASMIAQSKALSGSLVYVLGEISSRIKISSPKCVNIGCAVFAQSIEFWDVDTMTDFTKNKPNNKRIFFREEEL